MMRNEGSYRYNLELLSDLRSECAALYTKSITHCAFIRIKNHQSFRIGDREDWLSPYYKNCLYNDINIYQEEIDKLQVGEERIRFLTNTPQTFHENLLFQHNIWHFILKYKRNIDSVDFWCFASEVNNNNILNFYINNMESLDSFAKHIFAKFVDPIDICRSDALIETTLIVPPKHQKIKLAIEEGKGLQKIVDLSAKQLQCLQLLKRGFTHKMIACELGLSVKTVEFHVHGLKEKFHVHFRSQLLEKLQNVYYQEII